MFVRTNIDEIEGFMFYDMGHDVEELAIALARHPKVGALVDVIAARGVSEDLDVVEAMETSPVFKAVADQFVERFCMEGIEKGVVQTLGRALGPAVEDAMDNLKSVTAPGV